MYRPPFGSKETLEVREGNVPLLEPPSLEIYEPQDLNLKNYTYSRSQGPLFTGRLYPLKPL